MRVKYCFVNFKCTTSLSGEFFVRNKTWDCGDILRIVSWTCSRRCLESKVAPWCTLHQHLSPATIYLAERWAGLCLDLGETVVSHLPPLCAQQITTVSLSKSKDRGLPSFRVTKTIPPPAFPRFTSTSTDRHRKEDTTTCDLLKLLTVCSPQKES